MYRAAIMMRGSIVPCIFNKTLRLDSSDASPAAALTLVSTDIETMTQGIVQLHELWASFVEIGLATYLLQRQVGAACGVSVGFSFRQISLSLIATKYGIDNFSRSYHDDYCRHGSLHRQESSSMDFGVTATRSYNVRHPGKHQMAQALWSK